MRAQKKQILNQSQKNSFSYFKIVHDRQDDYHLTRQNIHPSDLIRGCLIWVFTVSCKCPQQPNLNIFAVFHCLVILGFQVFEQILQGLGPTHLSAHIPNVRVTFLTKQPGNSCNLHDSIFVNKSNFSPTSRGIHFRQFGVITLECMMVQEQASIKQSGLIKHPRYLCFKFTSFTGKFDLEGDNGKQPPPLGQSLRLVWIQEKTVEKIVPLLGPNSKDLITPLLKCSNNILS